MIVRSLAPRRGAVALLACVLTSACLFDGTGPAPAVLTSVRVTPGDPLLQSIGESLQLQAVAIDQRGEPMDAGPFVWTSADEVTAAVNGSGVVVAHRTGSAVVTATIGSVKGSTTVRVQQRPARLEVTSPIDSLHALGDTVQLAAAVWDARSVAVASPTLAWSSLDPLVASVDTLGRVVSVGTGIARIRAGSGDVADTVAIPVRQVVVGVRITPAAATVGIRDTLPLMGEALDANGRVAPDARLVWSSSDGAVIAVDSLGRAVGRSEGSARVTVRAGDHSAAAELRARGVIVLLAEMAPGSFVIHRVFSDGTGLAPIGPGGALAIPTAWSPDGSQIAFTGNDRPPADLYLMNADGSGVRRLTENQISEDGASWSPDGQRLVFTAWVSPTNRDVFMMNVDGTGRVNLTNHPAHDDQPRWSPDGSKIVFRSFRDGADAHNEEIYVMNADGSGVQNLTNHPAAMEGDPTWSPDGSRIAFYSTRGSGFGIFTMKPDGSDVRKVLDGGTYHFPSWSPDGGRLAFSGVHGGELGLFTIGADGSDFRVLRTGANFSHILWRP